MLGTYVKVSVGGHLSDQKLIEITDRVFSSVQATEAVMSYYDRLSELSYINANASEQACVVSDPMRQVLSFALKVSEMTCGVFDVTIAPHMVACGLLPDYGYAYDASANYTNIDLRGNAVGFTKPLFIDLGGIAKGYAVDKAFDLVKDEVDDITINAGGDIRTKRWQGSPAYIKAVDTNGRKFLVEDTMKDGALASSASYYLEGDVDAVIYSRKRTAFCAKPHTVSVYSSNCMQADALTKVAFLGEGTCALQAMGAKGYEINAKGAISSIH